MSFEIVPIPDEVTDYGWQYGWRIVKDGVTLFRCTTGGTGDCWNIGAPRESFATEQEWLEDTPLHICDLDEAIAALQALRDSEAHRLNVERWS